MKVFKDLIEHEMWCNLEWATNRLKQHLESVYTSRQSYVVITQELCELVIYSVDRWKEHQGKED